MRNILGLFSWAFAALRLQRCPDLAEAVSRGIGPKAGLPGWAAKLSPVSEG